MVVLEKLIIPECIQATKQTNPIATQLMVVKMFPTLPKDSPSLIFCVMVMVVGPVSSCVQLG